MSTNKQLLNKMVSSAMNKDGSAFKDAFNDAAMNKIQDAVGVRTQDVAKDVISSHTKETQQESSEISESLIDASVNGNETNFECNNGDVVKITQKSANVLIELHDSLNKDNQISLRNSISESRKEFNDMVNFAVKKIKG
tara:strand:+ start:144 stop:560 length:417 start_codon:yes stop_codon:yes gene_type:complete